MSANGYDAIVVGARCAGSTLALALAKEGQSVLVVDRDELGSDTLSTHAFFPNTIVRLEELGVLDRMRAEHTLRPMIHHVWILGRELEGTFSEIGGWDRSLSPRRVVLDRALAEAAMDAGAEIRFSHQGRGPARLGDRGRPGDGSRARRRDPDRGRRGSTAPTGAPRASPGCSTCPSASRARPTCPC